MLNVIPYQKIKAKLGAHQKVGFDLYMDEYGSCVQLVSRTCDAGVRFYDSSFGATLGLVRLVLIETQNREEKRFHKRYFSHFNALLSGNDQSGLDRHWTLFFTGDVGLVEIWPSASS